MRVSEGTKSDPRHQKKPLKALWNKGFVKVGRLSSVVIIVVMHGESHAKGSYPLHT